MGKNVQQPGGTSEHENAVTGLPRQLRVDTERHSIRLHDGIRQGGYEIPSLELIEALLTVGGPTTSTGNVSVVTMFNTEAELKAAEPSLNVLAILREEGLENAFVWATGAGDAGDLPSDIGGHWKRLDSEAGLAIMFWRAGLINLQIGGTTPVSNQNTTAWLLNNAVKLWDGTEYLDGTPVLWARLFAQVGGYYTGDVGTPNRLDAQNEEVTDLNPITSSGWYKTSATCANAPLAGVHNVEHRELTSAIALQLLFPHNTADGNFWIRYRTAVTPTWTTWINVSGELPDRLKGTSTEVNDANTPTESGWYYLAAASANAPTTVAYALMHMRRSASVQNQVAYNAAGQMYTRWMAAGVWGAWVRYYTKAEVDTILAGYYTESEIDTLLDAIYTKIETDAAIDTGVDEGIAEQLGTTPVVGSAVSLRANVGTLPNETTDVLSATFLCIRAGTYRIQGIVAVTDSGSSSTLTLHKNGVVTGTPISGGIATSATLADVTLAPGDVLALNFSGQGMSASIEVRNSVRTGGIIPAADALNPT